MSESRIIVNIASDTSRFTEAMAKAARAASKFLHALRAAHPHIPHNKARCAICSPRANPAPLCIDGHAYARRRKARKR